MSNRHRFALLLLAGALAWIVAFHTGRRLAYQLAYVSTAILVGALFSAWINIHSILVTRVTLTPRSQVGHLVEETLVLRNKTLLPKLWLEVRDFSTLPGHRVSRVVSGLGPGQVYRWRVHTLAVMRGLFRLGPMALVSSDPFGLFLFRRPLPSSTSILIYPLTVPLPYFPLPQGRLPGGTALRQRTHYATTNVAGVRDYRPGDALNRIHWRTTARTGHLMSKEFELDPYADVWCVLDMHRDVYVGENWVEQEKEAVPEALGASKTLLPPHSAEYAVAAIASVGQYVLRQQRLLGFISYAGKRHLLHPDRGERHLHRFLEMLALLVPRGEAPLHHVLSAEISQFPRHSTLIIATGDWTPRWVPMLAEIRRRGIYPIVILIDSSSFGPCPSVDPLLPHLARQNILTYRIRRGDDLSHVLVHPVVSATAIP